MTAPSPLISMSVGPNAASASSRKTPDDTNSASFATVLSQQGLTLPDGTRSLASNSAAKPVNPDDLAAAGQSLAAGEAQNAATLAEAGALAVAAQQIISSTPLGEQALALAAQAAGQTAGTASVESMQAARGQAQVALSAVANGANALTAALSTTATAPAPVAAVAMTAAQAAAATADAQRQAVADTPVLTNAVKSIAPVVETKSQNELVSQHVPALRLTPAIDVPTSEKQAAPAKPLSTEDSDTLAPSTFAALQAAAPQHATAAVADQASNMAAMFNAGADRQALPIANAWTLAQAPVPVALQVATPVGATHWGTELGQQLVAMGTNSRNGLHTAELRLDPPDLGPLRVTLNLADGVASASFVSAHASVRHAIETALPQLQQSFAQAGISLGQTSVGEQSAQQEFGAQQQGNGSQRQQGGGQMASATVETTSPATTARDANALVDTFA